MTAPNNFSAVWNATRFFDGNGNPLAKGTITTYAAGSFTVQQTTYSVRNGLTANPNPITLDGNGLNSTPIWIPPTVFCNFVLRDSNGNLINNIDNVPGITAG